MKFIDLEILGYFKTKLQNWSKGLFVQKEQGKGLSSNDYTTTEKNKLSGVATGAQVNVLEAVQINGTDLVASNKKVNIDLSSYATKADIGSVYKYKGSVENFSDLPTTGITAGDVYNVEKANKSKGINAGDNVAWTGTDWDVLAGTVDTSNFVQKVTGKGLSSNDFTNDLKAKLDGINIEEVTETEIDNMFNGQ